jgi:N-acyl-phosphatidylethanolamine-hydrolysing phospholipase D
MRARRLLRRRTVHAIAAVFVTLAALVLSDLVSVIMPAQASDRPLHHGRRGFRNLDPDYAYSLVSRIALVRPGLRFEDPPPIHAVLISHDHYDHLDVATVTRLARAHRPTFFVPLGLRAWFESLGIRDVVELDWWQSVTIGPLTMTAVPAQHSSGRSLLLEDQNERLWASWVVTGPDRRLFFAGDTGYHGGLADIGRRLGPFDLAALPIGGYGDFRYHHPNHLSPEETVQAFEDLRASLLVPMHWARSS